MKKKGIPQKTKNLTIGALLAAMGVAIIFLGSFIEALDLTVAALASFFCIFAVIELGGIYPWLIFATTGILSVILMPQSLGGWFYLLIFGYYPILKNKIDRLPRYVGWILKIVLCNLSLLILTIVSFFMFFGNTEGKNIFDAFILTFGGEGAGEALAIGVYLLANLTFIIYDVALNRIIRVYFVRIRPKFKFLK